MTVKQLAIALFVSALACFVLAGLTLASIVPYATYVAAFLAFLLGLLFWVMALLAWQER